MVTATEQPGGPATPWKLSVRAVCADVAADAVGVVAVRATSTTATAACPAGRTASGAGFAVSPGHHVPPLTELRSRRDAVTVRLGAAPAGSWRAYAICVDEPAAILVVSSSDQTRPSATTVEVAMCPQGWTAVGAGAALDGTGAAVGLTAVGVGGRLDVEYASVTGHEGAGAAPAGVGSHDGRALRLAVRRLPRTCSPASPGRLARELLLWR